jgi:hypothetical protein
MTDENKDIKPELIPLSVVAFGPISVMIVRQEGIIYFNIRHNDKFDGLMIPLKDIATLILVLEQIAAPAVSVIPLPKPEAK